MGCADFRTRLPRSNSVLLLTPRPRPPWASSSVANEAIGVSRPVAPAALFRAALALAGFATQLARGQADNSPAHAQWMKESGGQKAAAADLSL